MYLSPRIRTPLIEGRPGARRHPQSLGWLVTAAAIIGALSGCSPTAPTDPTASTLTASGSTDPTPSTTSPGGSSTAPAPSTSTAASATEPPGTVVPFRTPAPGSAAGHRIGLVASSGSDPFSRAVTDSIAAQVQAAGAELISCDPGANPTLVLDCARRLATQQVDGWITVQPAETGEAVCAAGPQDAPLIAIAAAPVSCETAEVGADDRQAGFLTGMELGRTSRLRSGCADDILVILSNSATPTASAQRSDGIRAGFSSQCPGTLTQEVVLLDAATQDDAYQAVSNALAALPDDADILLAAVDDGAAMGAAAAAIPGTRAEHVTMAASGADQRARCPIIADPQWLGDAALFPDRYGEIAVPALFDSLRGQVIPRNMFIAAEFLTADSLPDFYDVADCPGR